MTQDTQTVITFGTFDIFHIGHLNILRRAAALGERLVVGISTDELSLEKKGRLPVYPINERMDIVSALECVDLVFPEVSLEAKRHYIEKYKASVLVMGDDWRGRFDALQDLCEVVYFPRTVGTSTTDIIELVKSYG